MLYSQTVTVAVFVVVIKHVEKHTRRKPERDISTKKEPRENKSTEKDGHFF